MTAHRPTMIHRRLLAGLLTALTILAVTLAGQTPVPDEADELCAQADAKYRRGDVGGAVGDYTRAVLLNPDGYLAYYRRATIAGKDGLRIDALADFNRAIQLNPRHGPSYNGRGMQKEYIGDHVGAQADFTRAVELGEPPSPALGKPGPPPSRAYDPKGTLAALDRKIAANPNNTDALFDRGLAAMNTFYYGYALADFRRVLALDPTEDPAYNNMGIALSQEGDYAGAIEMFDRVLAVDPTKNIYYARGFARNRSGDLGGALTDLNRALALDPANASALLQRIQVWTRLHNLAEALADYDRLAELYPKDTTVFERRGDARNMAGDFVGAIADYDRALVRVKEPVGPRGLVTPVYLGNFFGRPHEVSTDLEVKKIGVKLWGQGDVSAALADIDQLRGRGIDSYQLTEYRGVAQWRLGNLLWAHAEFSALLQWNPKSAQAFRDRGLVREAHENFRGATADYLTALMLWKTRTGRLTVESVIAVNTLQMETSGSAQPPVAAFNLPSHPASPDEERRVSIHLALIMARQGRGNPMAGLRTLAGRWPPGSARNIALFLTGSMPAKAFFIAQNEAARIGGRSEACYYAGMKQLLANEPGPAAESFFRKSAAGPASSAETQLARAELARLTAAPRT